MEVEICSYVEEHLESRAEINFHIIEITAYI
jgi:hypothetical protein